MGGVGGGVVVTDILRSIMMGGMRGESAKYYVIFFLAEFGYYIKKTLCVAGSKKLSGQSWNM